MPPVGSWLPFLLNPHAIEPGRILFHLQPEYVPVRLAADDVGHLLHLLQAGGAPFGPVFHEHEIGALQGVVFQGAVVRMNQGRMDVRQLPFFPGMLRQGFPDVVLEAVGRADTVMNPEALGVVDLEFRQHHGFSRHHFLHEHLLLYLQVQVGRGVGGPCRHGRQQPQQGHEGGEDGERVTGHGIFLDGQVEVI